MLKDMEAAEADGSGAAAAPSAPRFRYLYML